MMGPYRTTAEPPERFERYWQMLERREKVRRALLPLMAVIALGAVFLAAMPQIWAAPETQPAFVAKSYEGEPWGFVIAATHTEPWTDLHPKKGQPPTRMQSPVSAAELQRALAPSAEGIRRCYVEAIPEQTRWDEDLSGDLVVTVHLRDGHQAIVVSGDQSMRVALGSCIEREIQSVKLPVPMPCTWTPSPTRPEERQCDVLWFNLPLRFTRS